MEKKLKPSIYKGMPSPTVELTEEELVEVSGAGDNFGPLGPNGHLTLPLPTIKIELESLRIDLHNQSYGMMMGSTGCASNKGGPGC